MTAPQTTSTAPLAWLRFPLAVAVVFIHSLGSPVPNCSVIVADPFSATSIYDLLRLLCSRVMPGFAVPLFFLISGYLFFYRMDTWRWEEYGGKLRRRVRTLLVPYLIWNVLYCLYLTWPQLWPVLTGDVPCSAWIGRLNTMGGIHILWDSHVISRSTHLFGLYYASTAPVLVPLWFVRDLMVVVLFAPVIYWLVRRFRWWPLAVVGLFYAVDLWLPWHGFSVTCCFWFVAGATFALMGCDLCDAFRRYRYMALCVVAVLLPVSLICYVTMNQHYNLLGRLFQVGYIVAAVVAVVGFVTEGLNKGRLKVSPMLAEASFFVYVAHIFLLKHVMHYLHTLVSGTASAVVVYFAVPIFTAAICLAIYVLWRKISKLLISH